MHSKNSIGFTINRLYLKPNYNFKNFVKRVCFLVKIILRILIINFVNLLFCLKNFEQNWLLLAFINFYDFLLTK